MFENAFLLRTLIQYIVVMNPTFYQILLNLSIITSHNHKNTLHSLIKEKLKKRNKTNNRRRPVIIFLITAKQIKPPGQKEFGLNLKENRESSN